MNWSAAAVVIAVSAGAAAAEPPEWARAFRLSVVGGPVASDVEISVNGEFVLEVHDEAGLFHEIGDLLRPGTNEIKVSLKAPGEAREGVEDLSVEIIRVRVSAHRVMQDGHALVRVVVPADAKADLGCAETASFAAGPPPPVERPDGLSSRYWVFVSGPPSKMRAAVTVNGALAIDASTGDAFVEITHLVQRGKNAAVVDVRPACFVPRSGRQGPFAIGIAPAVVESDVVKMTSPPLVSVEMDPKKVREPYTAKRSFRGW